MFGPGAVSKLRDNDARNVPILSIAAIAQGYTATMAFPENTWHTPFCTICGIPAPALGHAAGLAAAFETFFHQSHLQFGKCAFAF
jgi:hypothetical protein